MKEEKRKEATTASHTAQIVSLPKLGTKNSPASLER